MLKKKILANFQRIIELFTQKLSLSSQKYGFGIRDPRSGIRKKPFPDPGSRGQKGTGSRIRSVTLVEIKGFLDFFAGWWKNPVLIRIRADNYGSGRPKNLRVLIRNTGTNNKVIMRHKAKKFPV
jgi:hypothetical protein